MRPNAAITPAIIAECQAKFASDQQYALKYLSDIFYRHVVGHQTRNNNINHFTQTLFSSSINKSIRERFFNIMGKLAYYFATKDDLLATLLFKTMCQMSAPALLNFITQLEQNDKKDFLSELANQEKKLNQMTPNPQTPAKAKQESPTLPLQNTPIEPPTHSLSPRYMSKPVIVRGGIARLAIPQIPAADSQAPICPTNIPASATANPAKLPIPRPQKAEEIYLHGNKRKKKTTKESGILNFHLLSANAAAGLERKKRCSRKVAKLVEASAEIENIGIESSRVRPA